MSLLGGLFQNGVMVAWADLVTVESKGYIQCFAFKAIPLNIGCVYQTVVLAVLFNALTVVPVV